jgi:hypothetical protein
MKASTIVKLNFFILGLGLVLYTMYSLNKTGLPGGIRTALNLSGQASGSLSWCDTRVAGLIRPNSFRLTQEGNSWMVEKSSKEAISFLAVEKWFGEFCKVAISPLNVNEIAAASFQPQLFVKFIKGPVQILAATADGIYQWKGQFFRSKELDQALNQLEELSKAR